MLFQYIGKSKKKFHMEKSIRWENIQWKQSKKMYLIYIKKKCHNILEVFVLSPYDKHYVSSYLSSLLLPLIPKKGEKKNELLWLCNIYWGLSWWPSSLLPGYLWLAMPATDWPRPPEGSKDALGEKKKLPKRNDTLMEFYCRFFPPPNRSCCHPYFDLCIPWSIYAFVEGSDSSARLWGPPAVHFL